MKAEVTLDYYDGSKGKSKTISLDGFGLSQLSFSMMHGSVCGCTITKIEPLEKAVNKMRGTKNG